MGKIKNAIESIARGPIEFDELTKWEKRFEAAKASANLNLFDERSLIYKGTHFVDSNINSTTGDRKLLANNVRNIIYEFIESQVNTNIPEPTVESKRPGWDFAAKMIQEFEKHVMKESNLPKINDENERLTPEHGFSLIDIYWEPGDSNNPGGFKFRKVHPKQFIPQPGVHELEEMDYYFLVFSVTSNYIKQRYGIDLDAKHEQYPEFNSVGQETDIKQSHSPTPIYVDSASGKVSEVVCYYKDEDGDICRFAFANKIELENLKKMFQRKQKQCKKCNAYYSQELEECPECHSKYNSIVSLDKEILNQPMYLTPIIFDKEYWDIETNMETMEKKAVKKNKQIVNERMLESKTEIPFFVPKRYPLIVRENTPSEFEFGGQSDIDVLRDQQDAIKKLVSKSEEKVLRSGSLVMIDEDLDFTPTNDTLKIIRGKKDKISGGVLVQELKASIYDDIQLADKMYDYAQSTIGITDSYQGKYDPSAKSGKAKIAQIEQASGRLASKILNKYYAYKQMFEVLFEYSLAFYDEPRPYIAKSSDGTNDYGEFNKYEFLYKDDSGEWNYNTDFLFSSNSGTELPNDKQWLYEQTMGLAGAGLITPLQLFEILESIKFPKANDILNQMRTTIAESEEETEKAQVVIQMIAQMDPQQREIFLTQASPEEQMAMIDEVLKGEM